MQPNISETELRIDTLQLKKAALVFRAINHRLRQQMIQLLHNNQSMMVTDIYVKLRLEQSVASQHLAILRKVGMVNTQRSGKNVFYSINYQRLNEISDRAKDLIAN